MAQSTPRRPSRTGAPMKRSAFGLFLALGLSHTPQSLSAAILGADGAEQTGQTIDLQQVGAAIGADRSAHEQSRSDAEDIRAVIRDDESQAARIRQRLARGQESLPRIQSDLAHAGAAVDAGALRSSAGEARSVAERRTGGVGGEPRIPRGERRRVIGGRSPAGGGGRRRAAVDANGPGPAKAGGDRQVVVASRVFPAGGPRVRA